MRPSALITGGSRGIGYGIASHLASQGWALTLAARDAERLEKVRGDLAGQGVPVQIIAGDVADEQRVDDLVRRHKSAYGVMNALVLAAGVGSAAPLDGYSMQRLDKQFAVNFRAPFLLTTRALPLLRAGAESDPDRGGHVIALASIEGVYPEAGLAAYAASKAALISLVQSINIEEGANGVKATAISPGFVNTEMSAWVTDKIPPESMITIDDVVKVVDLVLSLSSTASLRHVVISRSGAHCHQA